MVRPPSVDVQDVVTPSGVVGRTRQDTPVELTIRGYGFVAGATAAVCRHTLDNGTVLFTAPLLRYINSTAVVCMQPPMASLSPRPAWMSYSHDGFSFSTMNALFLVIGKPAGLRACAFAPWERCSEQAVPVNAGDSALARNATVPSFAVTCRPQRE